MDPQSTAATAVVTTESTASSPRLRAAIDAWNEPFPVVPNAKLCLMCSYGGRILPRPHDKSLCYMGGDTRIVMADRHISFADLSTLFSHSLLSGQRGFSLKYQIPSEDLDSLVSVSTDEDLQNMIDEYDRTISSSSPSRLRVFLFLKKPETAASMGHLLNSNKSETWFVDALNSINLLPRRVSDSAAAVDCLLGPLDSDLEAQVKAAEDVHSRPCSPVVVDNTSSIDSTASLPSFTNLPRIPAHGEGGGVKMQEQRAFPQEEPIFSKATSMAIPTITNLQNVSYPNQHPSDDERSDHGMPNGLRKPPLPLQSLQRKLNDGLHFPTSPDSKHSGGFNLPSPDSVASDSSITSAASLAKTTFNAQDPDPTARREYTKALPSANPSNGVVDSSHQFHPNQLLQQVSSYSFLPPHVDQQYQQSQQQPIHPSTHFHQQHATSIASPVPMQSYIPMYASPQPSDQHYPYYLLPIPQAHPYNNASATSSHLQMTPNPPAVPASAVYQEINQPTYSTNAGVAIYKPAGVTSRTYNAPVPAQIANSTVIQVPPDQCQRHFPHISYASQPMSSAPATYAYEYANINSTHEQQGYYTQYPAEAPLPPQYQSVTPAAGMMPSEASALQKKLTDNDKQERVLQPLQ